MRRLLALTLLLALAGCGSDQPRPAATTPTAVPAPPNPACAQAQTVINDATTRFTARLNDAVTAAEQGRPADRDAAIRDIRAIFADWATKLRAQAQAATEPEFKAVLIEYAGAVDAVIGRVKTADDLNRLSTFDDQELDTAASRLAAVCR